VNKVNTYIYYSLLICSILIGCSKADTSKTDDRLSNTTYCNEPEAINYNLGFPGVPDNTKCVFPTQVFKGSYLFYDSVLDADSKFKRVDTLKLTLAAISNVKLNLTGFCSGAIALTANRYYKSVVDSLPIVNGSITTMLSGQYLCGNMKDTISGFITKNQADSTKISIDFTVATDSGIIFHKGTGTKK
jgi:hypothetical protein